MNRLIRCLIWLYCFVFFMVSPAVGKMSGLSAPKAALKPGGYPGMPFIRNQGQLDNPEVRYYADTLACRLFVTKDGRLFYASLGQAALRPALNLLVSERLLNSGPIAVKPEEPNATKYNVFKSRDRKKWHQNIASYHTLNMGQVYEGIGLYLKYHDKNVEKLFFIEPGASPERISLAANNAMGLAVNDKGELVLRTASGELRFSKPIAYQMVGNKRMKVAVSYRIQGNTYGFQVGRYDTTKRLIIDPLVNSYSIESKSEKSLLTAMTRDNEGNVYAAGISNREYVVYKFDPQISEITALVQFGNDISRSLLNTYLTGMALDSHNNVLVTGYTQDARFPVTEGSYDTTRNGENLRVDGFIIKFDSELTTILAATYLGGDWDDRINGMVIDKDDNIYVAGDTESSYGENRLKFPVTENAFDTTPGGGGRKKAFITKLDNNLTTVLASTLLGGIVEYAEDTIGDIALDANGRVYVGGGTSSNDFPIVGGVDAEYTGRSEAFVARLNANLTSLEASTYLGGMNNEEIDEQVKTVIVDKNTAANVYVAGWTSSTDFPKAVGHDTSHNREEDGFIIKLNTDLNHIQASTFLGGHGKDLITCMTLVQPANENAFLIVGGRTESENFPTTQGCHDNSFGGVDDTFGERKEDDTGDGFISFFDHELKNLLSSTYFGGKWVDYIDVILVNGNDILVSGETFSKDDFLPLMPNSEASFWTRGYVARFNGNGQPNPGTTPDQNPVPPNGNTAPAGGGGGGGCFLGHHTADP